MDVMYSIQPQWVDIKDYEGEYQINELGQVRTLKNNHKSKKYSILKSQKNAKNGYVYQMLYKDGKHTLKRLHRLVAEAFLPNPYSFRQVNHKDGNTKNNYIKNLEWCTPLENVEHASKVLGVMSAYKNANNKRKKKVKQIDYKTKEVVAEFESIRDAEMKTGIKAEYIVQICKGKFNQCFGYSWCYVEEI